MEIRPEARASKVALLVKSKPYGSVERRLLIDLLRSGENGETDIPERIVLPRLQDFAASILDPLEWNTAEENLAEDGGI